MLRIKEGLISGLLSLMVGCASVGLQPAQTIDDKLAYAYGVHTAVMSTASIGVLNHTLTAADGRQVLSLADQSKTLLDAAKGLEGTDLTTANSKLVLATELLTQLQNYLNARGIK